MRFLRVPAAALLALVVTSGVFLLMHKLISSGSTPTAELEAIAGIHFGKVEIPDEITTRSRRKPPKPDPHKEPPPRPKLQVAKMDQQAMDLPQMDLPSLEVPMVGGAGMFSAISSRSTTRPRATSSRWW